MTMQSSKTSTSPKQSLWGLSTSHRTPCHIYGHIARWGSVEVSNINKPEAILPICGEVGGSSALHTCSSDGDARSLATGHGHTPTMAQPCTPARRRLTSLAASRGLRRTPCGGCLPHHTHSHPCGRGRKRWPPPRRHRRVLALAPERSTWTQRLSTAPLPGGEQNNALLPALA